MTCGKLRGDELRAKLRKQEKNFPLKPGSLLLRYHRKEPGPAVTTRKRETHAHLPNACVELRNGTI